MERVIAYVDGFNLYFGLKTKAWKRYYWLNVQALVLDLLKPSQQLVATKYFTSRVRDDKGKEARQGAFIEALETLPQFQIYYGKYQSYPYSCRQCGHVHNVSSEKMTDVNIATELLSDAFQDNFSMAFLISADSDLVPSVNAVQRLFPSKRILLAFPPARFSKELAAIASHCIIGRGPISRSQFPPVVQKADGFTLRRPSSWQ